MTIQHRQCLKQEWSMPVCKAADLGEGCCCSGTITKSHPTLQASHNEYALTKIGKDIKSSKNGGWEDNKKVWKNIYPWSE